MVRWRRTHSSSKWTKLQNCWNRHSPRKKKRTRNFLKLLRRSIWLRRSKKVSSRGDASYDRPFRRLPEGSIRMNGDVGDGHWNRNQAYGYEWWSDQCLGDGEADVRRME